MDEFDDPKIIRLPVRVQSAAEPEDCGDLRHEVVRLLAEADPESVDEGGEPARHAELARVPASAVAAPLREGPPANHRNAVVCPQCDHWTWLATQHCLHCGYDLFAHLQREVDARRRQWKAEQRDRLLRWAMWLAVGGFAAILGSTSFPREIGWLVATAGLIALFFAYAFGKAAD